MLTAPSSVSCGVQVKFAPYFPESVGPESSVTFGEFCVTMTRRDVHQEYITSWLELQSKKVSDV